jgi:hypothetical protein
MRTEEASRHQHQNEDIFSSECVQENKAESRQSGLSKDFESLVDLAEDVLKDRETFAIVQEAVRSRTTEDLRNEAAAAYARYIAKKN